jgi:hypothetical protein
LFGRNERFSFQQQVVERRDFTVFVPQ